MLIPLLNFHKKAYVRAESLPPLSVYAMRTDRHRPPSPSCVRTLWMAPY